MWTIRHDAVVFLFANVTVYLIRLVVRYDSKRLILVTSSYRISYQSYFFFFFFFSESPLLSNRCAISDELKEYTYNNNKFRCLVGYSIIVRLLLTAIAQAFDILLTL